MRAEEKFLIALNSRREGHTLPQRALRRPRHLPARSRDDLSTPNGCSPATIARSTSPGDYFTMQVGDYPILVVRGERRRDPRVPQFLPPSRLAHLLGRARLGGPARLPLSQLELRPRRPAAASRATWEADFDSAKLGLKPVACESVGGYIWICLAAEPPDFAAVPRARWSPISRRTGSARRRSRSRARSSRTATGSSSGRTTASATIAPPTIPSFAAPSPRRRPSPASRARATTRDRRALGALRGGGPAEPLPYRRRRPVSASRACRCSASRQLHDVRQARGEPPAQRRRRRAEHRLAAAVPLSRRPGTTCSATTR